MLMIVIFAALISDFTGNLAHYSEHFQMLLNCPPIRPVNEI